MLSVLGELDWNSLLQQPDVLMAFVSWGGMIVMVLGIVFIIQWRRVQVAKYDAEIKARMVERGYTAEEIVRVLEVGASRKHRSRASCKTEAGAHERHKRETRCETAT